jgi:hypothetical protein
VSTVNDGNVAQQLQLTLRPRERARHMSSARASPAHNSLIEDDVDTDSVLLEQDATSPFWLLRDRTDHPDVADLRPTMRVLLQLSSETEMHPLVLLMTKAMVDASGARRVVRMTC